MGFIKELRKWLGILAKPFGLILPANLRLYYQALLVGLDAFILAYKSAREIQANKMKKEMEETVEKFKDPSITPEERLRLNAEMEKHFRHFVASTTSK